RVAQRLFRLVDGEARIVSQNRREQHAARRSEIDRAEVAAIDLLGRVQPLRRERAAHSVCAASSANASWWTQPVPWRPASMPAIFSFWGRAADRRRVADAALALITSS